MCMNQVNNCFLCVFILYFSLYSLLKGQEPDGEKVGMEKIMRQWIRDFPYHESELLQQIVRNLANVKIVRLELCCPIVIILI